MPNWVSFGIAVIAFSFLTSGLRAEPPTIDWSQGAIDAVGIGAPPKQDLSMAQKRAMAIRAATVDAQRQLLEPVQGVNIDAETTVINAMVEDDRVRTTVRGILQGASQVGRPTIHEDGSAEVLLRLRVRGELSDALLPVKGFSTETDTSTQDADEESYTGIVVDARGRQLRPALAPRILDEDGGLVYGAKIVSREVAVRDGMVVYEATMDRALANERAGQNPLKIACLESKGRNRTNIIVSNRDAQRVRQSDDAVGFLAQCRVVVVTD